MIKFIAFCRARRKRQRVLKSDQRQIQSYGELIVDDSISEKPFTDENEIINPYYDHGKKINFVSVLYHLNDVFLLVGYHLIKKTIKE